VPNIMGQREYKNQSRFVGPCSQLLDHFVTLYVPNASLQEISNAGSRIPMKCDYLIYFPSKNLYFFYLFIFVNRVFYHCHIDILLVRFIA